MKLPDELVTREQAAAMLGIKPDTLSVWACTKRYNLPYTKIGRSVRYRLSDIQHFIESRMMNDGGSHDA